MTTARRVVRLRTIDEARARWEYLRSQVKRPLTRVRAHVQVSDNDKTGVSINVPLTTCSNKTALCARICYAEEGPISFPLSIDVQRANLEVLTRLVDAPQARVDHEADIIAMQVELSRSRSTFLRWNGSGDLTGGAVRIINALTERHPELPIWVATRHPVHAAGLAPRPSLHVMLSADSTTKPEMLARYRELIAERPATCYLAWLMADRDEVVPEDVAVVFEAHRLGAKSYFGHPKACPVGLEGAEHKGACPTCQRCFSLPTREQAQNCGRPGAPCLGQAHRHRKEGRDA